MMLIDKGVAVGEVITIKLTSGEEIVAKLVEDQIMHYKLAHPMVIAMSPKGPALMPYLFTVDPSKQVKIVKSVVAVAEATDKQFADQFIQQTTGIAMA
jgi:hypothetical protein